MKYQVEVVGVEERSEAVDDYSYGSPAPKKVLWVECIVRSDNGLSRKTYNFGDYQFTASWLQEKIRQELNKERLAKQEQDERQDRLAEMKKLTFETDDEVKRE